MGHYVYKGDNFIQNHPECETLILKQLLERQQRYRKNNISRISDILYLLK